MKKMFTLLMATGLVTLVIAQDYHGNYGRQDGRNSTQEVFFDHRSDNHPNFNFRERDEQLSRINHEFYFKINSVAHNWFMSRQRKEYEISYLQNEKAQRIGEVYARYGGRGEFHNNGFGRNERF